MKFSRPTALALLTTALTAPSAFAYDFGNGFSLMGDVELEYVDSTGSGSSSTFGFADMTLGWRSQAGGAIGFGFDLTGVAASDIDDGETYSAFWGGLVLTTAFGEVTVGRPRPLLDTLSPAPDVGALKIYELELGMISGSFLASEALFGSDLDIYGISLKGSSGAFSYGAAVHQVDTGSNTADIVELTGGYDAGAVRVYGGLEMLDDGSDEFRKLILGARYGADRWAIGAELANFTAGPSDGTVYELYGEYEVIEGLAIGAQYLNYDDFIGESLYGISGIYSMGSGGFAELGYTDVTGPSDGIVSASIGFRF
jgi:hypothetical protein